MSAWPDLTERLRDAANSGRLVDLDVELLHEAADRLDQAGAMIERRTEQRDQLRATLTEMSASRTPCPLCNRPVGAS